MSQDNKAIAEQFSIIGEAFIALSAMFLDGGDKAAKATGTAKTATKSTAKSKSVSKPADDEHSEDDVRTALKGLMEKHGKDKMVEALELVGAGKLADVDDSQYGELMGIIEGFMEEEPEAPEPTGKGKTAAKKVAKKKGPTVDDVTAKFKELIAADKALAKSVLKELGVAKVSDLDEDQYQEAIDAVTTALEGADDDLI
jgi:hypothetical protein